MVDSKIENLESDTWSGEYKVDAVNELASNTASYFAGAGEPTVSKEIGFGKPLHKVVSDLPGCADRIGQNRKSAASWPGKVKPPRESSERIHMPPCCSVQFNDVELVRNEERPLERLGVIVVTSHRAHPVPSDDACEAT